MVLPRAKINKIISLIDSQEIFLRDKDGISGSDIGKYITSLTYYPNIEDKTRGIPSFLKLLFDEDDDSILQEKAKRRANMEYQIFNSVDDTSNLIQLIGTEPVTLVIPKEDREQTKHDDKLNTFYGVLSKEAIDNFRDYYIDNNLSQDEIIDVIYKVSKGLYQLDKKGFIHRDIKASNILKYKDKGWVLADLGNSGENQSLTTSSSKSKDEFWSPGFIKLKQEKYIYEYTNLEDLWMLGLTLKGALDKQSLPQLRRQFEQQTKFADYQEFTYHSINNSDYNDEIKIILKMLMGSIPKTELPKGETIRRCGNIKEFINFYEGKRERIELQNELVAEYTKAHDELLETLDNISEKDIGMFGTINYKTIDKIVTKKEKLEELANNPGVRSSNIRNKTYNDLIENKYLKIVSEEIEKINKEDEKFDNYFPDDETYRTLNEIIFLWGPPMTIKSEKRRKEDGKSRYTLNEILNLDTHFSKYADYKKYNKSQLRERGAI